MLCLALRQEEIGRPSLGTRRPASELSSAAETANPDFPADGGNGGNGGSEGTAITF